MIIILKFAKVYNLKWN